MWAWASFRLDCRLTQSTVQKRSSPTRACQYRTCLRQRGLQDQRLVVVDLVDAVVVGLLGQAAHRVDLRRAQERIDAVVLAVVPHQLHVEADHSFDPGGQIREAAGDLLGRHVGAAVVQAMDGDPGVDLVPPVTGALAHQQPAASGDRAATSRRVCPAGRSALSTTLKYPSSPRSRSSRSCVAGAGPEWSTSVGLIMSKSLFGDLDEARGAAEAGDPVDAAADRSRSSSRRSPGRARPG